VPRAGSQIFRDQAVPAVTRCVPGVRSACCCRNPPRSRTHKLVIVTGTVIRRRLDGDGPRCRR